MQRRAARALVRAHPFDVDAKAPRLKQAHRFVWEAETEESGRAEHASRAAEVRCFDEARMKVAPVAGRRPTSSTRRGTSRAPRRCGCWLRLRRLKSMEKASSRA